MPVPKRGNKYGAQKCAAWGISFDSKAEMRRYGELRLLEMAGKISGLKPHPKFKLDLGDGSAVSFTPDSEYMDEDQHVVEDVKSAPTAKKPDYVLRRKMFEAQYPEISFIEIRKGRK